MLMTLHRFKHSSRKINAFAMEKFLFLPFESKISDLNIISEKNIYLISIFLRHLQTVNKLSTSLYLWENVNMRNKNNEKFFTHNTKQLLPHWHVALQDLAPLVVANLFRRFPVTYDLLSLGSPNAWIVADMKKMSKIFLRKFKILTTCSFMPIQFLYEICRPEFLHLSYI